MEKIDDFRATSPNKAYLASCLRHSVQIQQSWTSDTLGTLSVYLYRKSSIFTSS